MNRQNLGCVKKSYTVLQMFSKFRELSSVPLVLLHPFKQKPQNPRKMMFVDELTPEDNEKLIYFTTESY